MARLRLGRPRARAARARADARRRGASPAALARLGGRGDPREAPGAEVGITLNLTHTYPATDSPADDAAARAARRHLNRWFLDPLFRGAYPADMLERSRRTRRRSRDGDLATIAAPLDFLGVNYYSPRRSSARTPDGGSRSSHRARVAVHRHGLGGLPRGLLRRCCCGVPADYAPPRDLHHRERRRVRRRPRPRRRGPRPRAAGYLDAHIDGVGARDRRRARRCAATSSGRCSTTSSGRSATRKRFGIVYVDYPTLERVPKCERPLVPRLHRGPTTGGTWPASA